MPGMRSRSHYYPCGCCVDWNAEGDRTKEKRTWRREVQEELNLLDDLIQAYYRDEDLNPFFWQ